MLSFTFCNFAAVVIVILFCFAFFFFFVLFCFVFYNLAHRMNIFYQCFTWFGGKEKMAKPGVEVDGRGEIDGRWRRSDEEG